eukprot:3365755-Rhodomonas_salina.5
MQRRFPRVILRMDQLLHVVPPLLQRWNYFSLPLYTRSNKSRGGKGTTGMGQEGEKKPTGMGCASSTCRPGPAPPSAATGRP